MTAYVLPFEKMHGLGNDFIILERRHLPGGVDDNLLTRHLCNRNYGIGADGLIIVDLAGNRETDFVWSFYNSDGSEAEMCGNGMRCFAKYVFERGFTDEVTFSVMTKAGIITPTIEEDASVTVNMGSPKVPKNIKEKLIIDSHSFIFTFVEIGNPHCVIILDYDIADKDFFAYGPKIEKINTFSSGTNVEFVKIINKSEIKCRVWERGAGATLACGTGACAALVAANLNDLVGNTAKVSLPGGYLNVKWDKNMNNVFLNGPATFVFAGQVNLDPKDVCRSLINK